MCLSPVLMTNLELIVCMVSINWFSYIWNHVYVIHWFSYKGLFILNIVTEVGGYPIKVQFHFRIWMYFMELRSYIYILTAILINKVLPNNATAISNKCPTIPGNSLYFCLHISWHIHNKNVDIKFSAHDAFLE
jgi:hypothetical protein